MARTPFCSQVLFPVAFFLCHPESVRLRSGQAPPRDPGSFSTPADAPPFTDQSRRATLVLHSGPCLIQSEAKNPGSFVPLHPVLWLSILGDRRNKGATCWGFREYVSRETFFSSEERNANMARPCLNELSTLALTHTTAVFQSL